MLLILLLTSILTAQIYTVGDSSGMKIYPESTPVVYLELGGNAFAYSVNWDSGISNKTNTRIGFMAAPHPWGGIILMLPASLYYLSGTENHKLELGAGGRRFKSSHPDTTFL